MASEPKPFASLSSGLLARKGAARPAMRPQGFGQGGQRPRGSRLERHGLRTAQAGGDCSRQRATMRSARTSSSIPAPLTRRASRPVQSPVHTQHAEIADRFARRKPRRESTRPPRVVEDGRAKSPVEARSRLRRSSRSPVRVPRSPRRASRPRSAAGSKAKAAFTLRLDAPTPSQAAAGLCRQRPLGAAAGDRRARPTPRFDA